MSGSPYRTGMATGLGVVLAAALVLAIVDIAHTGGGFVPLLGLWALYALPIAIGTGIVLGAGNAQWGDGWIRGMFRKLRSDAQLDASVAAILIAAALIGGAVVLLVAKLSVGLVGDVTRKSVGALLAGVMTVAAIPVLALGGLPLYRVLRKITALIPAIGPLSRVVLLLVGASAALVAAGAFIIFTRLDYQALNLGKLLVPALLPVVAIVIGVIAYGPLSRTRERLPSRGVMTAVAAVLAVALIGGGLVPKPAPATRDKVTDHSYLGALLIPQLRKRIDRDHDGHSAFFNGPDCDDRDPDVFPNATEVPGNGKDDNCLGGDGKAEQVVTPPPPGDAGVPAAPTISGGKNVLVIFVDTLRSDRLGISGYMRDGKSLTPRLDAFARESVVFENAYAQAPNTPRSVPSFLASRYPSQLVVDKKTRDYPTIDDKNDLLFEALGPAGMKTIGMTSHFYFCDRKRDPKVCPDVAKWMNSNVLQGAAEWDNDGALDIDKPGTTEPDSNNDISGPRIVKKSVARLEQLAATNERFAMLVHLFEPHSSYMTHPGFPITERGDASLEQKYDYEITAVDTRIGEVLDALAKTGLDKTTTVVVMSDHGEAFGAHKFAGARMFFHGQTLYRELLHVPLMFRVPGVKPRTAEDLVELIDLAPTIAALFGVKPPDSWRGRSLVPALDGKPMPPKAAFAEMMWAEAHKHEAKSMITADGKKHVFYRMSDSAWEIYDLEADPNEKKNIAESTPDAKQLQADMAAWIEGPLAKGAQP